MLEGIKGVAPTGIMLGFAILYFGVMNNAGLLDPLISRLLRVVRGDSLKILIGTVVIAMLAISHLMFTGFKRYAA